MSLVLDASMAVSFALADEFTPQSQRVLAEVARSGAFVPDLWEYEVLNALVSATRRGRLTQAAAAQAAAGVTGLPLTRVAPGPPGDLLHLAQQAGLSVYDAAYLHVAVRTALPLATLDTALADAARRLGVPVVG